MSRPIKVLAHRGASGYAPENTIPAFKMAADMGADGVELDIQLTKDGEIVVIHDETIDRTSNGSGNVRDYTLEELRQFDYNYQNVTDPKSKKKIQGEKMYPEYDKVDIPTMREVFELLKPTDMIINIELKTGIVFYPIEEKILELTKEMGMEDRVIYSSFNHYSVMKIKELQPDAVCGFLYADGPIDMPEYAVNHGVEALHPAGYNLRYPDFVRKCHEKNVDINVWTINTEEQIQACVDAKVTSIIGNYPDLAIRIIEKQLVGI